MLNRIRQVPQVVRFVLSGGLNTVATWLGFVVLVAWLPYQLAYGIVYVAGIILSYFLATLFVFEHAPTVRGFFAFPLVYVVQYALSALALAVIVEYTAIPVKVSPLVVAIIVFPVTFVLSRVVVHRTSSPRVAEVES